MYRTRIFLSCGQDETRGEVALPGASLRVSKNSVLKSTSQSNYRISSALRRRRGAIRGSDAARSEGCGSTSHFSNQPGDIFV